VTASRPWLGISTPSWLIKSDTPQCRIRRVLPRRLAPDAHPTAPEPPVTPRLRSRRHGSGLTSQVLVQARSGSASSYRQTQELGDCCSVIRAAIAGRHSEDSRRHRAGCQCRYCDRTTSRLARLGQLAGPRVNAALSRSGDAAQVFDYLAGRLDDAADSPVWGKAGLDRDPLTRWGIAADPELHHFGATLADKPADGQQDGPGRRPWPASTAPHRGQARSCPHPGRRTRPCRPAMASGRSSGGAQARYGCLRRPIRPASRRPSRGSPPSTYRNKATAAVHRPDRRLAQRRS
jgi:hypothetical protein